MTPYGSTNLAHHCLRTPSHYLKHCWVIIRVLSYFPNDNTLEMLMKLNHNVFGLKITYLKSKPHHIRSNGLNYMSVFDVHLSVKTNQSLLRQVMHVLFPSHYLNQYSLISNWLVPGGCGNDFKIVIFELLLRIKFMSTSSEIAFRWMPQNIVRQQAITWANVGPHLYGITRPHWVNWTTENKYQ